ncbi:hypothetical protein [Thermoactinospora rubra]|uniref:hypothetical protein n=1 Tax=Thermoactinospora rubra TaxID=1088767 RepID=UPI00117C8982|nr:hypothetical protein [Thermoactinospora rubra]
MIIQEAPAAVQARLRWALIGGWIIHLLVRLWLYRHHTGPVANPDEVGYLVAARWLAGGADADYSGSTFYQAGYALLLVPAYWLTSDPETVYRIVVLVGSAAAAGAFPLSYHVLRRLDVSGKPALVLAFVASLGPSLLVFSGLALVDAVLPTVLLGWLLAVHDLLRTGSTRAGVVGGVLSGFAMTAHMRGTVVLAVFVLVTVRARRFVPLAVAGAVAAAGWLLNRALSAALYPGGVRDLAGLLLSRITSLDGQAWAVSGALGQLWYLIVATWGLAGLGLAAGVSAAVRRGSPHRLTASALLVVTLGIAYASSAALPDEHRVGNYAYGRYLACVAVAWTLAGLVVLVRAGRRVPVRPAFWAVVLLAVSGGVAAFYAGDRLSRYSFILFDFPEVAFLSGSRDSLRMLPASLAALALLAAITAAASLVRRHRLHALAAVLAAANIAFLADIAPKSAPRAGRDWLPAISHGRVAVDRRVHWGIRVQLVHRVWWTEVELFDAASGHPPPGVCTLVVPPDVGPPPPGWFVADSHPPHWTTWSDASACGAGSSGRISGEAL